MTQRTAPAETEGTKSPVGPQAGTTARPPLKNGSVVVPAAGSAVPAAHITWATGSSAALAQGKPTDVQVTAAAITLLPLATRVPLKFGSEVLTEILCARVCLTVCDAKGRQAEGWGETPLSVQWAWPSTSSHESRLASMTDFCRRLVHAWPCFSSSGHPLELGYDFIRERLPDLLAEHNALASGMQTDVEPMPYLAAIICASAFDIALHDAFGNLHQVDIYDTYNRDFMSRDLADFLEPAEEDKVSFQGQTPDDYFVSSPPRQLTAWHLVGGLDPLSPEELSGNEPQDDHPTHLRDWIARDGLKCLKIKLRGNDASWDYDRLVRVGKCALEMGVQSLSADFNCCVDQPAYVNEILDRLRSEHPAIDGMLLYVEQPFPYELKDHPIDVRSISERKPIFLDESAHDWQHIRLGRELGWTGVALKTCKTQTGAILSLCWAKAHGMPLMVQDLTNPMLSQIPHVRLAAHAGTICGVETNAMQFYPDASVTEERVHPGLYRRRKGQIDLSTISGPGFGYRIEEINRLALHDE
ncbi:MAG: mandelate racemase/muconate lactonizing enzyme family protein [Planctomycetes bacterium]|nr:mandelate racemase/muconate lactonizing enzyme family protein [Planctomycetota bacterium]